MFLYTSKKAVVLGMLSTLPTFCHKVFAQNIILLSSAPKRKIMNISIMFFFHSGYSVSAYFFQNGRKHTTFFYFYKITIELYTCTTFIASLL